MAMNERVERTILRSLFCNEDYFRKILPFVKPEYYEELDEKIIFEEIQKFASKYDRLPTTEVILIEIEARQDVSDETYSQVKDICVSFKDIEVEPTQAWLLDATEKWCKDRAIYIASHPFYQASRWKG